MGELGELAASDEDGWQTKAADIEAIASARHADPFAVLGPHLTRAGWTIRAFAPDVVSVRALTRNGAPLAQLARRSGDFFEALAPRQSERPAYRLEFTRADGVEIVGVEQVEADSLVGGIALDHRQGVIARVAAHPDLVAAEIGGLAFARSELQPDDVGQVFDRTLEIGRAEPQIADVVQIDHGASPSILGRPA